MCITQWRIFVNNNKKRVFLNNFIRLEIISTSIKVHFGQHLNFSLHHPKAYHCWIYKKQDYPRLIVIITKKKKQRELNKSSD